MALHWIAFLVAFNIGLGVYNAMNMADRGFWFGINVVAVLICLKAYHKVSREIQDHKEKRDGQ
jgi:uncharacterized membrane protein YiaA